MSTIDLRGDKEARQLLDSLSGRELQNRTRRATRKGAAVFRDAVRKEARSRADLPDSFAKTATKGHRTPVGTSTGPTSPLLNIFEGGAGAHKIGEAGQILSNLGRRDRSAQRGRWEGAFFARAPVNHPGMAARPLIGPVFDAKQNEASEEAMDEFLAGIR